MWERLRKKPRSYWLISALILAVTIFARPVLDARLNLDDAKNGLFQLLTRSAANPAVARNVKLVWIGDDEFWGGEMQHRSPTNRAYLAKLLRAADAADASVIALDFDFGLAEAADAVHPGDYQVVDPPYRAETDTLMRTIGDVAQRRRIVLAKTIDGPVDGPFHLLGDVQQAYGMCTAMRAEGGWDNPGTPAFPLTPTARANIRCGYIALMSDKREVPPPAHIVGQAPRLDSFSIAIARARDPDATTRFGEGEGRYYASYIPEQALKSPNVAMPAATLLRDPSAAARVLQGFPVIIGAAWHSRARGAGELIDVHETPIGRVHGALIHANLAEAMLGNRTYPALSEHAMIAIEIVLGALAAVLFALVASPLVATGALIAAMPLLLGLQWLSLQIFGTFIDLFAPVVGLGVHAILDRLVSSHSE